MALTPSWPGPTGLATTTDGRKAIAGLLVKSTSGVARSGVFPAHADPLVTARGDLNVDIGAFQGAAVQFGGPILLTNDGTAQLPSPLVSPVSGTNWYVIYAKQNESAAPGTDAGTTTVFGAALSTSSFAAARANPAQFPTGALELGTVQLPTGKAATNAVGVTIAATHQFTAAAGGAVWLRTSTEATAWTPEDGSIGFRLDTGQTVVRSGGVWRPIPYAIEQGTVACPTIGGGSASGWSALIDVTFTVGRFTVAPHVKAQTTGPDGQITMGGGVVEQVTASGCKVRGLRVGSEPNELFSVQWTAIQMTSASAVG